jgi:hypothetical protein
MKYISLFHKIKNKFLITKILEKVDSNLFYYNKNSIKIKKILIYFPNSEFMHLGDHFFFEPLIKALIKNGYIVDIVPIKQMEFYFKDFYNVPKNVNINEYDLIISRVEFYDMLKKFDTNSIFINTSFPFISSPLCCDITNKILYFLGCSFEENSCKPSVLSQNTIKKYKFNIELPEKYILFNNYIDSRMFSNQNHKNKKMIEFIIN